MRKLVTGVDAAGRSCVVSEADVELGAAGPAGILSAVVATTSSTPPSSRPPGRAPTNDLGVGPGLVAWLVVSYEPDLRYPMHNTDTIDFDTVLDGTVVLVLDDGDHPLEQGDVVIVNGVDHSWKAGSRGCRLSIVSLGTPPRG